MTMFAKYLLPLVLLACGSCRTGATVELQPILRQHQLAMRQLMNTYTARAAGPAGPAGILTSDEIEACFNYYNDAQDAVASKYNVDYMGCVSAAADAKSVLSAQSAEQRADIVASGSNICTQLNNCQENEDSLDFFKCTYNVTDANLQDWYDISVQSDSIVNNLKVQYQKIDDDANLCTTAAKNEYVSSLSSVASNLNKCLIGEFVPPSEVPSTEAPSTEAPSTAAPSTEAPSTAAPSTEASSTEAPSTEAPSTEAPSTEAPAPGESSTEESGSGEPSTEAPAPSEPSTESSPAPVSPDLPPEEDVMRYRPMTRMNMWNMLRRL